MNLLCTSSQGKDCKLSNVKVYCGKDSRRRRRSLHTNVYVISFEIQINDQNPSSNEQEEKKILSQIAADLDGKKADIEKASIIIKAILNTDYIAISKRLDLQ